MRIPAACDVVVIGGGPSGSLAATYLSQSGYEVVLLEKQKHPRFQVGENLIPDFWKYCDEAKVSEKIAAAGFVRKAGGTVDWHGTRQLLAFKDFGYTRPALHIERDRFDDILIKHASEQGVQVHEEVTVLEADFSGLPACSVSYRHAASGEAGRISCKFVIDASGQNAVIARQLGLRRMDDAFRFMSVWGYFTNSSYLGADGEIHSAAELLQIPPTTYVTSLPSMGDWGWCWHIMLRDCVSVGLVLPLDEMKNAKEGSAGWEAYFLRQCESLPGLSALLAPARCCPESVRVIRDFSYRCSRVTGPGYFLAGDAAGFVDPIFSIGVVLGMYAARAASWCIGRILREPHRAAEHQAIYESQLQGRLELSRALALPQYEIGAGTAREASKAVQFMDGKGRALANAASRLTARSQHFQAMTENLATPSPQRE